MYIYNYWYIYIVGWYIVGWYPYNHPTTLFYNVGLGDDPPISHAQDGQTVAAETQRMIDGLKKTSTQLGRHPEWGTTGNQEKIVWCPGFHWIETMIKYDKHELNMINQWWTHVIWRWFPCFKHGICFHEWNWDDLRYQFVWDVETRMLLTSESLTNSRNQNLHKTPGRAWVKICQDLRHFETQLAALHSWGCPNNPTSISSLRFGKVAYWNLAPQTDEARQLFSTLFLFPWLC